MIGQNNGIKEQWDRIHRFRAALDNYSVDQKTYEDMIWAFFQATHHLKDWISSTNPGLALDVETAINNSSYLKIAADLGNRSKHMLLTRPRGGNADITRNDAAVSLGTIVLTVSNGNIPTAAPSISKPYVFWKYYAEVPGGSSFDQKDLADLVIIEWKTYLTSKGLL
jgi:hypothetical protein